MPRTVLKAPNDQISLDSPLIRYPCLGSFKIDGLRLFAKPAELLTSSLKPQPNVNLAPCLGGFQAMLAKYGMVADAELWSPTIPFNELSGILRSHDGVIPTSVKAWVFDMLTLEEWASGVASPFVVRYHRYSSLLATHNPNNTVAVTQHILDSAAAATAAYETAIHHGYEGIMLRDPHAGYKQGRSTPKQGIIFKYKEWITVDGIITGFQQGRKMTAGYKASDRGRDEQGHMKREKLAENYELTDKIGAVHVTITSGTDHFPIGTDFKAKFAKGVEAQFKSDGLAWGSHDEFVGRHVEMKCMRVGAKSRPRLPHITRWRTDLDVLGDT